MNGDPARRAFSKTGGGRIVKAEPLTPEAFRPFGRVLAVPASEPEIERGYLSWWGGLCDLDFPDSASLGFLRFKRTGFTIFAMERHLKASEIFIPVCGTGVIPFAPAVQSICAGASNAAGPVSDEKPDLTRLSAFIVVTGTALVIERGVWHFPGFALTERMDFFLIVRKKSADDVDMKQVEPIEIVL